MEIYRPFKGQALSKLILPHVFWSYAKNSLCKWYVFLNDFFFLMKSMIVIQTLHQFMPGRYHQSLKFLCNSMHLHAALIVLQLHAYPVISTNEQSFNPPS